MMRDQQADQGPFLRDAIEGIEDVAYFYTGAEGPPTRGQRGAIMRYLDDKVGGEAGRHRAEHELSQVRELTAKLVSGTPESVAVLGNTSDALHRLVGSIDFQPGDNVITTDIEFPSGVLTLLALRELGVEVRIVRSKGGFVSTESIAAHVDGRTRVIIASHVSYSSGARIDAAAISSLARANDTVFILDVTQSLGVLQVDASLADALVCSTYKWLLGPHGIGLVHVSRPEVFGARANGAGWRSVADVFAEDRLEKIHLHADARRLELGFPSFPSAYLLSDALATLTTVDPSALERHAMDVSGYLAEQLSEIGFPLLTPLAQSDRGTNISVISDDGERISEHMFRSSVHAWGGDGRLRFSVHGFNTHAEVDTTIQVLRKAR